MISNEPARMTVRELVHLLEDAVLDHGDQQVSFTIEFYSENADNEQIDVFRKAFLEERLTKMSVSVNLMR
jgi:hypothetical protein